MNDILLRVELRNEDQARTILASTVHPWIKEQLRQGRELVAEFTLREDAITTEQRGYLHAVVLTECATYCSANGSKYPMPMWKEYFRARLLGSKRKTYVDPMTGRKLWRTERVSTESLGVRRLATYIDEVIAIIADELGHAVSQPLPPHLRGLSKTKPQPKREHIDAETGEITEVA